MEKDMDAQFLCKDCARFNLCQYYDRRKEDSYICKYFHLSENQNKCGDLISRQAVENITWEEPSYTDPLNVLTEVREKVRALPSVENKGEWIPVSERLPEEREWYLAVFKEKDTDFQLIPRVADYIGHGENKWRWIDDEGLPQEYFDLLECVAWQPLPEPYKKGGE